MSIVSGGLSMIGGPLSPAWPLALVPEREARLR